MKKQQKSENIEKESISVNSQRLSSSNNEELDMSQLVKTIDNLKERIEDIEKKSLEHFNTATGEIVKTGDIKIPNNMDIDENEIKPLEEITNDPESIVVSMKWLQYLVDSVGKINLPDILGYYVDINWITDDVRLDLIEYSKGIATKSDDNTKKISNMSTKDHIQSLLFIQKLKRKHLDERFIMKIDREIEKIAKSIENFQFK
jgi:flagellar protein FlaD